MDSYRFRAVLPPWVACGLLLGGCGYAGAAPSEAAHLPDDFQPDAVREALARHLDDEVLPYLTDPARTAARPEWAETAGLQIVRQLRTLFVHAVAIEREGDQVTRERIRDQYDRHFARLVEGFRGTPDGAWVVATTYDGTGVLNAEQQTISQAYVVYIMAELATRISDSRARRIALETFALLDARGHDPEGGGYVERVDLPLGAPGNATKQLGTNLHVALAMARLQRIAPSRLRRERLQELYEILTTRVLLPESANAPLGFTRDWRPAAVGEEPQQQTLYGHNAELAWYVYEVADALGKRPRETLPWLRRVARGVSHHGIGPEGQVYVWGPWVGPPQDRDQIRWWPQTEAMIMLARLYQLTGMERYWHLFEQVARFTFERFVPDHSGAWLSDVNLRDGTTADGSGDAWFAGLHVVRMLVECERALREVKLPPVHHRPGRVAARRATQVEPGFAYYQGRSAASIASELKANGFDCLDLICTTSEVRPPDLIEEAHQAGLEVWGSFFSSGIYMPAELFPPERDEWLMQFTGRGVGPYRFFSYVHPEYGEWWKDHLARFYATRDLDGMVWYEVHYPTQKGMTAYGRPPVFGDVSPAFVAAFRRATGRRDFPSFADPDSPQYYETDRTLYEDYVEFRVSSVVGFQRDVLDGEGGFRRRFPDVPFASWTITISDEGGLEALRENEAQDPARFVQELRPDLHFLQSHAPDWSNQSLGPDYVARYAPYVEAVRDIAPDLPLAIQGDVGSTCPWRRDPDWMRGFEEQCHRVGADTTTYYEFSLRWEVYFEAPRPVEASLNADGRATVVFDQRVDPASCAFLEGLALQDGLAVQEVQVDGNLLRLRVEGELGPEAELRVPVGGITNCPAVRYPLVGRPEAEAQGPVNAVAPGTTVALRRT